MDAKVVTADMASQLMVWGEIGRPNQREWVPEKGSFSGNDGLYPSGYYLFRAQKPALDQPVAAVKSKSGDAGNRVSYRDRLWKGWVLPASEADTWFVAGSEQYYSELQSDNFDQAMETLRARYRRLKLEPETALTNFQLQKAKGALFLDSLRRKLGDERFFHLMSDFFRANTTKPITAHDFLGKSGASFAEPDPGAGATYVTSDIAHRLSTAVLVYGTVREAGANRYAAECLQREFLNRYESQIPIYKDFEATDEVLRHRDVIFVGRPEANSALALWSPKLNARFDGAGFDGASFDIGGSRHVSEREALLLAAPNPLDAARMLLVVAGNDALRTVKLALSILDQAAATEYVVLDDGRTVHSGFSGTF
jgi:hypothetical protein